METMLFHNPGKYLDFFQDGLRMSKKVIFQKNDNIMTYITIGRIKRHVL